MAKIISRLAPSPTGHLHLGNAWTFVLTWLMSRSMGGEVILRIDDLDPERSREEYTQSIMGDLQWLGLDWDHGPGSDIREEYYQSKRTGIYDSAILDLEKKGWIYPCFCSRKQLREIAGAPHLNENVPDCPCSSLTYEEIINKKKLKPAYSLKFKMASYRSDFTDLVYGKQESAQKITDFAIKRSDGVFAYQLASTIDDALMGVNLVVRGRDLLDSCPRQIAILSALGFQAPRYAHVPLILDSEGQRLAKRHASSSIAALRKEGVSPERIIGQIAFWARLQSIPKPMKMREALEIFSYERIPDRDIRLSGEPLII